MWNVLKYILSTSAVDAFLSPKPDISKKRKDRTFLFDANIDICDKAYVLENERLLSAMQDLCLRGLALFVRGGWLET